MGVEVNLKVPNLGFLLTSTLTWPMAIKWFGISLVTVIVRASWWGKSYYQKVIEERAIEHSWWKTLECERGGDILEETFIW